MSPASAPALRRGLRIVALVAGALAPLAGSPYLAAHGRLDVERLAAMVADERDHVSAVELAQWIHDRKPGLRVIDVRPAGEFAAYHLPTAENLELPALVRERFTGDETLVLYSGGGAHAAQAWVLLAARGQSSVFFLRGGLAAWLDEVMNPTLARDAPPAAVAEFERVAALSRYFGGVPRRIDTPMAGTPAPPATSGDTAARIAALRRRGC
ncbi:MAG: rhodanese-like domain-containing protein [Thermoanaerobaculia bacterium]